MFRRRLLVVPLGALLVLFATVPTRRAPAQDGAAKKPQQEQPERSETTPDGRASNNTPKPGDTWTIGVIADNRGGSGIHRNVLSKIHAAGAELVLNLGDMVYPNKTGGFDGVVRNYRAVFGDAGEAWLAKRVFVTAGGWDEQFINQAQKKQDQADGKENLGNRRWPGYEPDNAAGQEFYRRYFKYKQRAGKPGEFIREYTELGDYYVKYRNVHIISLYLTDEWPEVRKKYHLHDDPARRREAIGRQTEWLDKKLAAIRKAEPNAPLIVMAHDGIWHKGSGTMKGIARALATHRVDMALCGDGHIYFSIKDPWTMKFMVPSSYQGGSDGYFLVKITPSSGRIDMEHYRHTGKHLRTHGKFAGKRWK